MTLAPQTYKRIMLLSKVTEAVSECMWEGTVRWGKSQVMLLPESPESCKWLWFTKVDLDELLSLVYLSILSMSRNRFLRENIAIPSFTFLSCVGLHRLDIIYYCWWGWSSPSLLTYFFQKHLNSHTQNPCLNGSPGIPYPSHNDPLNYPSFLLWYLAAMQIVPMTS